MPAEAITEYKRARDLGGPPEEIRGLLGYVYAVSGNRSEAENTIAQLKEFLPEHTRGRFGPGGGIFRLGDKRSALHWLDKAQEAHVTDLIGIEQDSHFAELRSDPRFQAIVQRVGAPR